MQHDIEQAVLMNIKRLRSELKVWGRYWAHQERGQGYASRSACDRLSEPFIISGQGGSHEHMTPDHINKYDMKIQCLAPNCRRALRTQYISQGQWQLMGFDSKKSFLYWLRRAEMELVREV